MLFIATIHCHPTWRQTSLSPPWLPQNCPYICPIHSSPAIQSSIFHNYCQTNQPSSCIQITNQLALAQSKPFPITTLSQSSTTQVGLPLPSPQSFIADPSLLRPKQPTPCYPTTTPSSTWAAAPTTPAAFLSQSLHQRRLRRLVEGMIRRLLHLQRSDWLHCPRVKSGPRGCEAF